MTETDAKKLAEEVVDLLIEKGHNELAIKGSRLVLAVISLAVVSGFQAGYYEGATREEMTLQ